MQSMLLHTSLSLQLYCTCSNLALLTVIWEYCSQSGTDTILFILFQLQGGDDDDRPGINLIKLIFHH